MKTHLRLPLFTLSLTLLCLSFSSSGWGQIAAWDMGGLAGNEVTVNATTNDANLNTSILSRGSGLNPTALGNAFSSNNFTADGTEAGAIANNKFLQFQIAANSGYKVSLTSLDANFRRSGTGPNSFRWRYSLNGVDFFDISGVISYTGTATGGNAQTQINLSSISALQDVESGTSITIRLYGWGASATTGTFAIGRISGNDLAIGGTVELATTDPVISTNPSSISNLDYIESEGPSASQTFEITGSNFDGTNDLDVELPIGSDFEISADNIDFFESLMFPEYNNAATTIYVRLKAGLTVNTYNDNLTISSTGADTETVNVSGAVTPNYDGMETFENYPETTSSYGSGSFLGVNGNTWNYVNARGDIDITFETVTLQNNTSASLNSSIAGGLSSFSFDYMQAFTTWVNLEVYINGNLEATVTSSSEVNVVKNSGLINLSSPVYGSFDIEFKQGTGGGQVAIDNFNWVAFTADYTYETGSWTPSSPNGNATASDNIQVINGVAVFDQDIEMNHLIIDNGATLEVEGVMAVNGDLTNNGTLIFKSTSVTNTAQLDEFSGNISGVGSVTTERFIPARRAFRLLSSSVNTSGNIRANWQEGQNNTGTNFPDDNFDTNPGFGTHITGSTTGLNGFDATPSGNYSLFTLNNVAQAWEAVTNTDVNTITAGTAYRLFVRGDRSINVTDNASEPTNTTLRASGTLAVGPVTDNTLSPTAEHFNFIGNPLPAAVDMELVLGASQNLNPVYYWVWDPTLGGTPTPGQAGGRGAFVTIDVEENNNSLGDGSTGDDVSQANRYLQPGQAAFVQTLNDGAASITFQESHKAVTQPQTQVFNITSDLRITLYGAHNYASGASASDGLRIKFSDEGSNAITSRDAMKFFNQDENLATQNNGQLFSIEDRALPEDEEVIPLFTNQYRYLDYVMDLRVNHLEGINAFLRDYYTDEKLALPNNQSTIYAFTVDPTIPGSVATDRFAIVFEEEVLSTPDLQLAQVVVFPNPVHDNTVYVAANQWSNSDTTIALYTIQGQRLLEQHLTFSDSGLLTIQLPELKQGIYILNLTDNKGTRFHKKLIIK
jgi:hypothetical protein